MKKSNTERHEDRSIRRRNPAKTKASILEAALFEFCDRGFSGARLDRIGESASVNKRMIYHYFGGKEGLYLATLEQVYEEIRKEEASLYLYQSDPVEGMRRMVRFSFQYSRDHPKFTAILNQENMNQAKALKQSKRIREIHTPLVATISDLLLRGEAIGVFRKYVDPVQLYLSIAGMSYFYFSNIYTLSVIFDEDFSREELLSVREDHIIEVIMSYLTPRTTEEANG